MKFHRAYAVTKSIIIVSLFGLSAYFADKLGSTSPPTLISMGALLVHILTTFFIYRALKRQVENMK